MSEKYGLSKKTMTEEYEDLLFRKVMAIYAQKESEKINSEEAGKTCGRKKELSELFLRTEKAARLSGMKKGFLRIGRKLSLFAAAFIIVALFSILSVAVVPARMQDDIREFFSSFFYVETHESVDIGGILPEKYISPESFSIENALAPTWLPEGYELCEEKRRERMTAVTFGNSGKEILIMEYVCSKNRSYHLDFDKGDTTEEIIAGGRKGILITKAGGKSSSLFMSDGAVDVIIHADEPPEVILRIAENMKKTPHRG